MPPQTGPRSAGARKVVRMGRKRKTDRHLPARVYRNHGAYYFAARDGKWIRLGTTEAEAIRAYADLIEGSSTSFAALAERYRRVILPKKSPATQREQSAQLERLIGVFGAMNVRAIRRGMIAEYRDRRPPIAANRELALLSHMFARAMEWELIDDNPCTSVARNPETPRERYVTDDEFTAVFDAAPPPAQAALRLSVITGQRQGDILKLQRQALTPDGVVFRQSKTGKRLLIEWSDALRAAVDAALALPREGVASTYLIVQRNGQPYSSSGFQSMWQRLIRDCHARGLIAERFTFHDLRAKAGTDGPDGRLLGHSDERLLRRVYRRLPERVKPAQ